MNGPEHYAEAERLLKQVRDGYESGPTMSYQNESCTLAEAQVHATLALAAATIECASDITPPQEFAGNGNYITQGSNQAAWREVTA